ncbi:MAG: glycosyltransferase family 2 protein [Prolixibacteraceae bacterium]|nr:glycosyltransferase family 2 protein [Prolixibacteraceae bacterium]
MNNAFELTILMPCLNEELTLGKCIERALRGIISNALIAEILVADNGSTDHSVAIAESMGARVVHVKEKGYGNALRAGIEAAKGKYIIMGDSDCSYDFEAIGPFMEKLREGYDLVMGNRFKGGIKKGAMPFLHRYLGNPVLSFIGRLFFGSSIGDFHCGLRGFNRQAICQLRLSTAGMEFASEMVVKASLNRLNICEVPAVLYPDERGRLPHLRTWRDGWRHLRFLLVYSPRWLFFYPGLFLIVFGLIMSVILIVAKVEVREVHFDVHSLLYLSATFYLGFQLMSFYVFARYFGILNNMLPDSVGFRRIFKLFSLERGLFVGLLIGGTGFALSAYALSIWKNTGFGALEVSQVLRIVIPAVFFLILGVQIILNSFFLGILGLSANTQSDE